MRLHTKNSTDNKHCKCGSGRVDKNLHDTTKPTSQSQGFTIPCQLTTENLVKHFQSKADLRQLMTLLIINYNKQKSCCDHQPQDL